MDEPLTAFIDKWEPQLRKGVVELAIIGTLHKRDHYGFELIDALWRETRIEVPEGTIYPLLIRLVKDGVARTYWSTPADGSAPRKFYALTPFGHNALIAMRERWAALARAVSTIMENSR